MSYLIMLTLDRKPGSNFFLGVSMNHFVHTYQNLLTGVYCSFDRMVIGAYYTMLHKPGGLLTWFRRLQPNKPLDKNQLMRFACRFGRRTQAFSKANGIALVYPKRGTRKHELAQTYLKNFQRPEGIFLIMVVREMAWVYESYTPKTAPEKLHRPLNKKMGLVNYYYFHIRDKNWGHVTIGISPHPPFAAKIILNGHNWLAQRADRRRLAYQKHDNCLIDIADGQALQELADTLSEGHLLDVCRRWMPRVMMGLTPEELRVSGIQRQFYFMQTEYAHNMLFRQPRYLSWVYQTMIDNTRQRLRPGTINTVFGKDRRGVKIKSMSLRLEQPEYDLTTVNFWFGKNRIKTYDKGDGVLRTEVTINHPRVLGLKKSLSALPFYRRCMENMISAYHNIWHAADQCRLSSEALEDLQAPTLQNNIRIPGISLTHRRLLTVLVAALELAKRPDGFATAVLYAQVCERMQQPYTKSQLNYDLRKLKAKTIIEKIAGHQRYRFTIAGLSKAVGLMVFRDEILQPVLSNRHLAKLPGRPRHLSPRDQLYHNIQLNLEALCQEYGLKQAA
jgi:hypothetical protein